LIFPTRFGLVAGAWKGLIEVLLAAAKPSINQAAHVHRVSGHMFKKERDLAERSKTLLKNKEVRNLKADIVKKFPNVNEEELNTVIPNKADITVTKLANKTLLYSINGVTLLFDIEGRGNLCPALPFLWRFPNALPTYVIHSPVSEFVLRGADLMIPGICKSKIAELQSAGLKEGSKASIRVAGNPLPFAVGDSLVSGESLASGKLRGRAVTVLHVYGDLISTASVVPNSGFGPSRIYALEGYTEPGADADGADAYSSDEDSDTGSAGGEGDDGQVAEAGQQSGTQAEAGDLGADGADAVAAGIAGVHIHDAQERNADAGDLPEDGAGVGQIEEGEDGAGGEGIVDCDVVQEGDDGETGNPAGASRAEAAEAQNALLLQAVLLASKYVVKDKQLPMLVSTYWALIQR
jgi:translation initiation factor 2D